MNKYINPIVYLLLLTTVIIGGCKKDFLEEPKPASDLATPDVFASEVGVRSYFNGIYRRMRVQYGTTFDVFGIAHVNMAREVKGMDVVMRMYKAPQREGQFTPHILINRIRKL